VLGAEPAPNPTVLSNPEVLVVHLRTFENPQKSETIQPNARRSAARSSAAQPRPAPARCSSPIRANQRFSATQKPASRLRYSRIREYRPTIVATAAQRPGVRSAQPFAWHRGALESHPMDRRPEPPRPTRRSWLRGTASPTTPWRCLSRAGNRSVGPTRGQAVRLPTPAGPRSGGNPAARARCARFPHVLPQYREVGRVAV